MHMPKKVLAIGTSPRKNSNSDTLLEAFCRGAENAGHRVTSVSLKKKDIRFCTGCFACHEFGHCVIKDDVAALLALLHDADVVVFATPIYYYEMSGQMKVFLDRCNPIFESDYRFTDIYFLSTAADEGDWVPQRAENGLGGWIECFARASLKGSVFAGGVNDEGDIENHPALDKAYEMGLNI